jgi:hypothetical protein
MPRFPDSSSWPIDLILFEADGAPPAPPTPEQWIDVLQAELLPRTDEPGVLTDSATERHGWGGFGSANQIVRIDGLLFLTRRSFVRRVPPGTLREYVEKRAEAWCHDAGVVKCPKKVRADIKDQVTYELTRRAIPSIRDVAVVIDTENQRAYILARSSSGKRSGIFSALRLASNAVYKEIGVKVSSEHRTLGDRLLEQYGTQRLPGALDQDFMRDLIGHGRESHTLVIGAKVGAGRPERVGSIKDVPDLEARVASGDVQLLRVELGGRIQASAGTEVVTARGEHETERMADMRVLGDEDSEEDMHLKVQVRTVQVLVWDALGKWSFVLAPDATITRCDQPKASSEAVDDALGTMWLRAQLTRRATEIVDQLVHAYVVTRLKAMIDAEPQRPLFLAADLKPLPCSWCASVPLDSLQKLLSTAHVQVDTPQTEMFVPGKTSGTVTITADDAARALLLLGDSDEDDDELASDVEEEVVEVDDDAVEGSTPVVRELTREPSNDSGSEPGAKPGKAKKKDAAALAKAARDRLVAIGHDPVVTGAVVADEQKRGRFDGDKKSAPKAAAKTTTDSETAYQQALNIIRGRAHARLLTTPSDLSRILDMSRPDARKLIARITANGEMPQFGAAVLPEAEPGE